MSTQGMTIEEANNFLALEPRLVQLLKQAVEGMTPAVHVFTASDLADVKETAQKTPSAQLIYGGYRVVEDAATTWRLEHTWLAVAAVRNVATTRSGQAARQDAGLLATRITGALAGTKVAGAVSPLVLTTPPPARYSAGFQYIPAAFLVQTIFRKPTTTS